VEVEEVKMFLRLLPILATTAVFWTTYAQMITFSVEQGATMDRRIGPNNSFAIPPASMVAFTQAAVLIMLPIYDRFIVPAFRSWRRNEHGITPLQRIGAGLICSTISMLVAAAVEQRRLRIAHAVGDGDIGDHHAAAPRSPILPMSVFYLVPQYVLTGIANALVYIGQLHLFYSEAPHGMRSFTTGLCLASFSIGFFFSSALVDLVNRLTATKHRHGHGWLSDDLNHGRLDCFYLLLAASSFGSFLLFLLVANWYVYNHPLKRRTAASSGAQELQ
jgi:peptide/histidine transporter 3/4